MSLILPNTDVEVLLHYLTQVDRPNLLLDMLMTFEDRRITHMPARKAGGVIPDPRILGTQKVASVVGKAIRKYPRANDEHVRKSRVLRGIGDMINRQATAKQEASNTELKTKLAQVLDDLHFTRNQIEQKGVENALTTTFIHKLITENSDKVLQAIYPPRQKTEIGRAHV